jgi:hypothetical protein
MKDIELRFVEREETMAISTYTAVTHKLRVLQYRKRLLDGWEQEYWTEWQDVPLEVEEKTI